MPAPEKLQEIYMKFGAIGIKLSKAFHNYENNLDVIFVQAEKVLSVYNSTCEKLSEYQAKMSAVKKEECEETLKAEKQSLMVFAKEYERFNQESNVFRIALTTVFDAAAMKLSSDICEAADFCQRMVAYPTIIDSTDEAVELDDIVFNLMNEVKKKIDFT